jgi:hypothetical protein
MVYGHFIVDLSNQSVHFMTHSPSPQRCRHDFRSGEPDGEREPIMGVRGGVSSPWSGGLCPVKLKTFHSNKSKFSMNSAAFCVISCNVNEHLLKVFVSS